jgi:hypothetical protein
MSAALLPFSRLILFAHPRQTAVVTGGHPLRASTRFVVFAFAFAGLIGPAAAQYFPPQTAPDAVPTYSSAPLPAPGAGSPPAPYGQPAPLYRDHYLVDLPAKEHWEVQTALLRRHAPLVLDDLA